MSTRNRGKNTGIVILGMHRSGTSLTAHLLGELGCSYGGALVEARSDNPLGYWEHAGVVAAHNDFLTSLNRRWDDPRAMTAEHFASPQAQAARATLASIFDHDFAPQNLWVLKDPRHCLLLPLWDELMADPQNEMHFLQVVRHPLAVAKSLAKRDAASLPQAFLLWLRHHLVSERHTRGLSRAWISFEEMVADPGDCLERACDRLGLTGRLAFAPQARALAEILDRSQVHHRGPDPDDVSLGELYPWVDRSYRALSSLVAARDSEPDEARRQLDRVGTELETAERLFHGGLVVKIQALLDEYSADRAGLQKALDVSQEYVQSLLEALATKDQQLTSLWDELQKRNAPPA